MHAQLCNIVVHSAHCLHHITYDPSCKSISREEISDLCRKSFLLWVVVAVNVKAMTMCLSWYVPLHLCWMVTYKVSVVNWNCTAERDVLAARLRSMRRVACPSLTQMLLWQTLLRDASCCKVSLLWNPSSWLLHNLHLSPRRLFFGQKS